MRYAEALMGLSIMAVVGLLLVHPFGNPRVESARRLDTLPQGTGDPARGKIVFQKRCTGCHALDGDREGPRLSGVFGRKAGSRPGYEYSAGLKNSGILWDKASLEKWLSDPDQMVPDTKMDFRVPRAQERADLIAFFQQQTLLVVHARVGQIAFFH
jgi:cytochrome c2